MTPPPIANPVAAVSSSSRNAHQTRTLPWKWVVLAAFGIALGVGLVGFISGRLSAPTTVVSAVETLAPLPVPGPHIAQTPKPRLTAIEIPVDVSETRNTAPAVRVAIPAEPIAAQQETIATEQETPPLPEAASIAASDPSAPPTSADILAESNAEPAIVAAADSPNNVDDQIPPPPRYLHAPFSFEQTAGTTTVVVPLMGISKPSDVLELAPQPGVAVVLSKAKLPRRAAAYTVKHPVINFVSLEARPLGVYVRVLFGPKAQGFKVTNSLGEIRIVVNHKL